MKLGAVLAPSAADRGVRILLTPAAAAAFEGKGAILEIDVRDLGETTAQELAVSLQDFGPVEWRAQALPALPATLRYELPASVLGMPPEAIGLRPVSAALDYVSGVEITGIRARPADVDPFADALPPL